MRAEDNRVLDRIEPGSSVLDLGCGDGHLLARLRQKSSARLCGVDVDTKRLVRAAQHDIDVIDCDLNRGLPEFDDGEFDFVVIASTLQVVPSVRTLLDDALRVGSRVVLSFANFAYEPLRRMLAQEGLSPKAPGSYGFEWYDTPNHRFPSILDVRALCGEMSVSILEEHYYQGADKLEESADLEPNRHAESAVFVLSHTR